jgi:hypothetical protein
MHEILPILGGTVLGACLALLTPAWRWRVGLAASIALAAWATFVSGEWQVSPWFLLLDLVFVAVPAAAGFFAMQRFLQVRGTGG